MIRAVLTALLAVAFASCAPGTSIYCTRAHLDQDFPIETYAFVGKRHSDSWVLDTGGCPEDPGPGITGHAVEAYGPDGLPLATEVEGPIATSSPYKWRMRLSFTPTQLGAHHLLFEFQPGYGLRQYDIQAVADLRSLQPILIRTPGVECFRAQLTPRGGMLCNTGSNGTILYRGEVATQTFPAGTRTLVAQGSVWVLEGSGELSRREDDGAGPLRFSAGPWQGVPPGVMSATANEVVVGNYASVSRYSEADGGLSLNGTVAVPDAGVMAAVAYDADAGAVAFSDGSSWGRAAFGDRPATAATEALPGAVSGASNGHLWFRDFSGVLAHSARPGNKMLAQYVARTFSPTDVGTRPVLVYDLTPYNDHALGFVPSVERGEIVFTLISGRDGAVFQTADEDHLYARGGESHYFWPLK